MIYKSELKEIIKNGPYKDEIKKGSFPLKVKYFPILKKILNF